MWLNAPEVPATAEAREKYFGREIFDSEVGVQAREIIDYELANTAVARPSTIGYVEFEEIVNRAFADVRNGSDPATALNSAQEQLESAWKAYR